MPRKCGSCAMEIPDGPNPDGCIDCKTKDVVEKASVTYKCTQGCGTFCEDELTIQNCPLCGIPLKEKAA